MNIQKEQDISTAVAAQSRKYVRKPSWKVLLGFVMVAITIAYPWSIFWPQFEGKYLGHAGSTEIEVSSAASGKHVTISDNTSGTSHVSAFEAKQDWYELRFGSGLEQQAIEYHPLEGGHYELVSGCQSAAISKQTLFSRAAVLHPYLLGLAIGVCMIVYMFYVLNEKAKAEPELIYPMWLAYFGALFGSAGVLIAAGENGIFGFGGEPRNDVARAILDAVDFFLGIGPECSILVGLLAFVVFAQSFAYVFSGLSGAAQRPRHIWLATKWAALLIAKAFIGASAIVLSLQVVGSRYYWVNNEPRYVTLNVIMSVWLLFIGLFIFCSVPLKRGTGRPVGRNVRRFHRCMRRRLRRPPNEVMRRLQKRRALTLPWR